MIIETTTIIISLVIIALVACSIVCNPLFRKIGATSTLANESLQSADGSALLPDVSIVVLAHGKVHSLDSLLPLLLEQHYTSNYEIVVVGTDGDHNTETIIKQYSASDRLYATYIPSRTLFMSRAKLAVALGVKAAHHEWIVILGADSLPMSDLWLMHMAQQMTPTTNLVIGYSNYSTETSSFKRFYRLLNNCYLLRKAERGTAYRSNGSNIAFRKSAFIDGDGYRGNLQYVNGEYDFLINKYARPHTTNIVLHPKSFVRDTTPTTKEWRERCITYCHVRRFLQRSASLRFQRYVDVWLMLLGYLAPLMGIAYGILCSDLIVIVVAAVAIITILVARSLIGARRYRQFSEPIAPWLTIAYELLLPMTSIVERIRYWRSDERDFTTHKL